MANFGPYENSILSMPTLGAKLNLTDIMALSCIELACSLIIDETAIQVVQLVKLRIDI